MVTMTEPLSSSPGTDAKETRRSDPLLTFHFYFFLFTFHTPSIPSSPSLPTNGQVGSGKGREGKGRQGEWKAKARQGIFSFMI